MDASAPAPFAIPEPPPPAAPVLEIGGLDPAAIVQLLAGQRASLGAAAHALHAHALAAAQSFADLLSLGSLTGVERHAYQIETVRRVLRALRGRALLADEVGLGKTIEAIMILREYQLRGMVRRALILAPPALVPQWVGELAAKAGIEARHTDDAQLRLDPDDFWRGAGVVVASIALARAGRHAPAVQAHPWDMVIVDEAHHVKNRSTLGWKLVDGMRSRFLLLLTATPIENDLEELYQLVTLLKPGQLPPPAAFRKQFINARDRTTPRDRDGLRTLLGEVMIRNTRARSGLRLPPRFVTTVVVDPAPDERALYERTIALLRAHAGDPMARRAAATLLLEAGSSPQAVRATVRKMLEDERRTGALAADLTELSALAATVEATRKAQSLMDLVRAHGEQMLVFSRYRHTLAFLERLLAEAGIAHVVFHGGLDGARKREAIEAFRGGARVMLASDAGGEGQNLHFCRLLVNFDLPWNPMLIEQRIGRLHRFGQTREVQVYNLCARGTIEERVLDVLDRRVHLFELVVGEMDMVLGNLTDDRDLEERILALYAEARNEVDLDLGFDAIARELLAARGVYEKVRALDQALFGEDFET